MQQVALHRSLTSLLRVAEIRPVNWRRYCASPRVSPFEEGDAARLQPVSPPLVDTAALGAAAANLAPDSASAVGGDIEVGVGDSRDSGDIAAGEDGLIAQCGILPPVCLLFALCESGGRQQGERTGSVGKDGAWGSGARAGELQPLMWQLLELTLRPEDSVAAAAFIAQLPEAKLAKPVDPGTIGVGLDTEEDEVPSAVVRTRAQSPAELLIEQGLVGPDTLVEMAQDLLSSAAGAEARKRTARVLHHLWAASPASSRPQVRGLCVFLICML